MKIYLKFDHAQKDTFKAIGYEHDGKRANKEMTKILKKYDNQDITKSSQLAEIMHNDLDYEIILFLALKAMEGKLVQLKMDELKKDIEGYLDSL